ncbi:hypothetical protein BGX31_008064 [Mortierella sp. GBA43]|nr:hypothetical protein BGX31_008064 [Mortierella sp. GBA43]
MDTTSSTTIATTSLDAQASLSTPTLASNSMDFFFSEAPDQLIGATELDIEMSPILQDRIAQLCLLKMRQASSGRESLHRLAMLSWLQTKMLLMPVFTTPQAPTQLDQWISDFASLDPSTTSLQGPADMNWGLDLTAPPLVGLNSDLDLWTMDTLPQDLAAMGAFSFSLSQPSAPDFLDVSNSLQLPTVVPSPIHLDETLITTVVNSAIVDPLVKEQETSSSTEGILAPPVELLPSQDGTHGHQNDIGPMEASMVSTEALEDHTLPAADDDDPESGMDIDLPIQDMTVTSPPPSSRPKRRSPVSKKTAAGQRRTRKSTRGIRSQRLAARLAASTQDDGEDGHDDDLEQVASRIKRRRGSEDSSSSDSCPDSAPSSPRTPPSTFEGPNTPSADHTSPDLYHVNSTTPLTQDGIPNKSTHLTAAVAVEDLVNLKHMDDGGELSTSPHGRYPSRRPSTRPFDRF